MENTKSGKSNSGSVRGLSSSRKSVIPSNIRPMAEKKDASIGSLGLESIDTSTALSINAEHSRSIDTEGKTPTEAIKRALAILKVERNKVKVKILSEEQRGLFGMEGARPAKVRVTLLKKKKT